MIARIAILALEIAALGGVYVLLRWANKVIDEQLAGAQPAPQPQATTQTPVFCPGCQVVHEPPLHPHRWPVSLYVPCGTGFVGHHFHIEGDLGAAHVALYRVPRLGREPRA